MNDLRRFWKRLMNADWPLVAIPLTIIEAFALVGLAIVDGLLELLRQRPSTAGGER